MKTERLGGMIASLRKAHHMTQAQLAEKMGVTDKAVSKWERDLSCPDIESLPKLAELFGVSVDELMQGEHGGKHTRQGMVGAHVRLALKGVALAMGVAVTVLSVLREIDAYAALTMLGLGLTCAGISLLDGERAAD